MPQTIYWRQCSRPARYWKWPLLQTIAFMHEVFYENHTILLIFNIELIYQVICLTFWFSISYFTIGGLCYWLLDDRLWLFDTGSFCLCPARGTALFYSAYLRYWRWWFIFWHLWSRDVSLSYDSHCRGQVMTGRTPEYFSLSSNARRLSILPGHTSSCFLYRMI
jgi:hypothetical protein